MLGLFSALCSLIGSIILAFRVYQILNKLSTTVSLHEMSINKLINLSNDPDHVDFTFIGANKAYEEFMEKGGLRMLVVGFSLLAIGAFLKIIEISILFLR